MIPLQSMRRGIETGDWNLICLAYHNLTGEALDPPRTQDHTAVLRQIANLATSASAGYSPTVVEHDQQVEQHETAAAREELPASPEQEAEEQTAGKPTGRTNVYGLEHEVVSQPHVDEAERQANAERARRSPKKHRSAPCTYDVVCSECKRTFQSDIPVPKGVGKLCPKCMGARSRK